MTEFCFVLYLGQPIRSKKNSNHEELINAIKQTVQEIPLKMIRDAIDEFRSLVYVVEKNCGELILNKFG